MQNREELAQGCEMAVSQWQALQGVNEINECEDPEEARSYGTRLLIYIIGSTSVSVKQWWKTLLINESR